MLRKRVVALAMSVGCLTLGATGVVSAATTVQTYGPTITPGWVSNVYGFSARDICRFLEPGDKTPHKQVNALGLSLTYSTTSTPPTQTQNATSAASSISGTQKLTGAKAIMAQCR